MTSLVFDIEADGLLGTITKIHCIAILDVDTMESMLYVGDDVSKAIICLQKADLIIGHNISGYDINAIEKVTGIRLTNKIYDTIIAARMIFPNIPQAFYKDPETGKMMFEKGHSLKAWGMRLGHHKIQLETDWKEYTDQMGLYCIQDVRSTAELYKYLIAKNWPQSSIDDEMTVAPIISNISNYGIYFDVPEAEKLYAELLEKRMELADAAQKVFPPWYRFVSMFTPKATSNNYTPGAELCKIELIQFNPQARGHIIDRLINKYNWKPVKYTSKGNTVLDEAVLSSLPYPEAKALVELFKLDKLIGQLATGDNAWLRLVEADGRIHGFINQNGATTGRCSHAKPNLSQVPKDPRCRVLFKAAPGRMFVGCDFTGLEYAALAGYMSKYDGGVVAHQVAVADKSNGTDVHTLNGKLFGISRETAKKWIYAVMYGTGDCSLGKQIDPDGSEQQQRLLGKQIKEKIFNNLFGLKELINDLKAAYRPRAEKNIGKHGYPEWTNGWVRGLDGRQIPCEYEYRALNYLLQSAGAFITKRGLVEFVKLLEAQGLTQNKSYGIVIYSHDEIDIECDPKDKEIIKQAALRACELAGEFYKFPCKMSGEVKEGNNWWEIH